MCNGVPVLICKANEKIENTKPHSLVGCKTFQEAKALLELAIPILLTNLVVYARAVVSMVFLGRLGEAELAGGTLAMAFANISGYSVLSGLSLGMEPICSQAYGAGQGRLLSTTLHRAVLFLLTASIPVALLWLQVPTILSHLRQEPDVAAMAHTYILYSLPELLTSSFLHPIKIYLRAQGITRPLTRAALLAALLSVPLNLLLLPRGVAGVALASSASNFLSLLLLLAHLPGHVPTRACLSGWGQLLSLAGPTCISVCLEWWWYEIMIVLCGLLLDPTPTLASMGILIQTTALIYNFPCSLGYAVSTRVGNELGANRPSRARAVALVGISISAAMGLLAAAFAATLRDHWGRMYTADLNILHLTASALPILGLCELGNCPQTVACGVVRGTARPTTAANINLAAFYLVGTPVAIALTFYAGLGFVGLWLGLLAAQISCAGLMLYVVSTTDWSHQAERAQKLTTSTTAHPAAVKEEHQQDLKEPLICVVVATI